MYAICMCAQLGPDCLFSMKHWRGMGADNPADAVGPLAWLLRRRWAFTALRANARLLLDRLDMVGSGEAEDHIHMWWTCPALNDMEDQAVVKTQRCVRQANAEQDSFPCLWMRGLLPALLRVLFYKVCAALHSR